MENVSPNRAYVISVMTVEITPMSRGQMVVFVVGVLDTFLAFLRTLCVGQPRPILFKINCLGYSVMYDILLIAQLVKK